MGNWWQKLTDRTGLTIGSDHFGYSIQDKPRFFLEGVLEKFVAKTVMPDDQQKMLEELSSRGNIVYAIKYRSQLDLVFLSLRLYQLGLPVPSFIFDLHPYGWQPLWYSITLMAYHLYHFLRHGSLPDPYAGGYYREKLEQGEAGLHFLLGKSGYYKRAVLVGNDPLDHLVAIQKKMERPVYIVPLVVLYNRNPGRQRRGMLELFLGQREQPGPFRKLISFIQGYPSAALEAGEALNLQDVLPELSENQSEQRKQIFQLRRELIDAIDENRRAIVGPAIKSKLELKEIILHHPRLETLMQRKARASGQELWRIRKEADQYLEEIAADYNYTLINLGENLLTWVWNNLFDGVEVDVESLQKVKKVARNNTLVYIPCHKSHIDYLILSYILFKNNLYSPYVAAGKNLAFWPLGSFFRRCGAFFIRRSFKGLKFYAEVFSLYVKTMVQLGNNIEFFIEGGRSRTGKMVLPKLGLLAILIQAVEEGFCDDLVFVPTSICYDRIPEEEAYLRELTGGSKVDENLRQLVGVRRFLKKRYGRVYVQFAEPISLRQYLERHWDDGLNMAPKERHAMYRDFSYRIINSINQASLVTPHALVAAALLSSSRRGVSMGEFQSTCRMYFDYLEITGVQFSKTLRNYKATVEGALHDLERSKFIGKLKDEDEDLEDEVYSMEDSKRLALEYYKNNMIHFLLPACFVATSILSQQTFRFSVVQIVDDVATMKDLFKYEFVYDNDLSNEQLVVDVLEAFERLEWLYVRGEGDQPYALAHKGHKAAQTFHNLIRNYFEGYWLVLRASRYLHKKSFSERDFIKKVMNMGQKALKLELVERPESISKLMFSNAIQYLNEKGVLEKKVEEDKDKVQEWIKDAGNRLLVQDYSRHFARFLGSHHFTLQ